MSDEERKRIIAQLNANDKDREIARLRDELFLVQSARKSLFNALADIIRHWDGDETEDYIVAKLTLVQWNEAKPFAELDDEGKAT